MLRKPPKQLTEAAQKSRIKKLITELRMQRYPQCFGSLHSTVPSPDGKKKPVETHCVLGIAELVCAKEKGLTLKQLDKLDKENYDQSPRRGDCFMSPTAHAWYGFEQNLRTTWDDEEASAWDFEDIYVRIPKPGIVKGALKFTLVDVGIISANDVKHLSFKDLADGLERKYIYPEQNPIGREVSVG